METHAVPIKFKVYKYFYISGNISLNKWIIINATQWKEVYFGVNPRAGSPGRRMYLSRSTWLTWKTSFIWTTKCGVRVTIHLFFSVADLWTNIWHHPKMQIFLSFLCLHNPSSLREVSYWSAKHAADGYLNQIKMHKNRPSVKKYIEFLFITHLTLWKIVKYNFMLDDNKNVFYNTVYS